MRVVAMVSGGKDSCYNMMQCVAEGHEIVALANLHPKDRDELDSFMYQTVGHMGIEILAQAMGLPLYRRETKGKSTQTGKHYVPTDNDEVEDLYSLLAMCKREKQVEAVAVGAILSDYQRVRVENVCSRLNLVSLAYLWRRDQTELLQEMIDCQVHAIVIKVAALGLLPDRHLGKSLRELQPHLAKMRDKYGLNVCGEGGEYETFTLDCPLFKQRIVIEDFQTVISSADPICPVGYINFTKLSLQTKESTQCCDVFVKKSLDYISDLNESTYSDLSDPDLSETELELIEKETRMRESLSQNELMISRSNSFGRHLTTTASSPIPIVTKSASVDEPTPSPFMNIALQANLAGGVCAAGSGGGSCGGGGSSFGAARPLDISAAGGCGSLSLAISSTGATAGVSAALATQPPSPMKIEREFRPLRNRPMAVVNQKGWLWVAGVQGCACSVEESMQLALDSLCQLAAAHNYELTDFCFITLYVRSMADYPCINRIYGQIVHFQNPPTRVCVECPLPDDCHVVLEGIAYRQPVRRRRPTLTLSTSVHENDGGVMEATTEHNEASTIATSNSIKRHTMHVQGISHWAPANIGPYSQSTKIDEITYISGQIALVPGSMTIIEGGIRPQCKLTLRHVSRIAKAMNAQGQLRDVVHGICFVTHPSYIAEARRQWERRTTNAIMDYIVVPALPRDALVEWQVWTHTHNDRFEYEETGCSVSDYTIAIRRRWNYENNCAAIVCYVSTGLASSTTQLTQLSEDILSNHCRIAQSLNAEQMLEILQYILNRLLKDHPLAKRRVEAASSSNNNNNNNNNSVDEAQHANDAAAAVLATTPTANAAVSSNAGHNQSNNCSTTHNVPAIHLKVFYQVTAAASVELLLSSLHDFRQRCADTANIVYTVIPACSLHNFSTFLSICGVRHE